MAEWRLFRGWSTEELQARLSRLVTAQLNFEGVEEEMNDEQGWHHYHSDAIIAAASPDADARFERARIALTNYRFSDARVVTAHFDPATPLLMRRLLLEIKVLGLHYLCPALVNRLRDQPHAYGFR